MKANVLVVDDEPLIVELVTGGLVNEGFGVFGAGSAHEALNIFEREQIDLAILDCSLPDLCGADLFRQLRSGNPDLPVVFLTGYPNLAAAVELMKSGARDYITKPFNSAQLSAHVRSIFLEATRAEAGSEAMARQPQDTRASGRYIFSRSKAMQVVEAQIENLRHYPDATVLISGPTGTGKSAIARRIHELTWQDTAPFVEIDCSTIPRELCESELFGHEKGAFTGAHRAKQGLFEAAGHGTAFLDEIGELDPPLQAKFLRVLEARRFKRVGGHASLAMPARVIAATNRCLPDLVQGGRFREDLYFRLNVYELWIPPLKDRAEDIPVLAQHFLGHFASRYRKPITGLSAEALDFMRHCEFPGNVRELRNMIERAVINADSAVVGFGQLVYLNRHSARSAAALPAPAEPALTAPSGGEANAADHLNLAATERDKLLEALAAAGGNKSRAAKLVGLSRTAFHRRLQKHRAPGPARALEPSEAASLWAASEVPGPNSALGFRGPAAG